MASQRWETKAERDSRAARRIQAIANALDGMSRDEVAQSAGMNRQTLHDRVLRYEAHGIDGLYDRWGQWSPAASGRAHIFAAIKPGMDNGLALVLPYANTEAMQVLLYRCADTIGEHGHAIMVLDRAGWHISRGLVPGNITFVPRTNYSPELNPVERVWPYLKEQFLSYRLIADYDAIVAAAINACKRFAAKAGRLTKLGPYPWILKIKS